MQDLGISDAIAHPLAYYRNQLEFNGYRVEEEGEALIARHPRKPPLELRQFASRGGVLARFYWTFDPSIERTQLLELSNNANAQFICMRAYVDQENKFWMEAFSEGDYDKTTFSVLLENIGEDVEIFDNLEKPQI